MTRRRFYAPPEAFAPEGGRVSLSADETRHLRDVLRLRAGDEAYVFDGEGREFACAVAEAGGRGSAAVLEVRGAVEPPSLESPLRLTLAVALLKFEKFDLVVQKAAELGVRSIEPVLTKRSDVRLRDARDAEARVGRWKRLALEAAKQSGRALVPEVAEPRAFGQFVSSNASQDFLKVMFAERGGGGLGSLPGGAEGAAALVGPEGGWEEEELEMASAHGWRLVTLGGRVLRAETAAITACALLQHLYGDLR
jgi:16S rRNA (uracil1498-N3)-methyltransferase